MLKLATILDNPGEPSAKTQYRDPRGLRELGYNGVVLYDTTCLSGVDSPDNVGSGEIRRWLNQKFEQIVQRIQEIRAAGLDVYLHYDVLSLARTVVEERPEPYVCRNRPQSLCPASETVLERCGQALQSLIRQLPDIQGVVLRFGDTDAPRMPHLVGNDIYTPHCARCSQMGRADRIVQVLTRIHDLVVYQMGKRLIARAWNVRPNGMHDSVELCRRLAVHLPGDEADDRLVLSFKFTHTDFWRYQRWNPASLEFGRRPILYEVECQREFEGKGGIPDWQAPLWSQGGPEVEPEKGQPRGLAEAAGQVRLAGLWAWVRGGGWGGPFIEDETWIDANVFAVPRLADQPDVEPVELARQWIDQRLGVKREAVWQVVERILLHSPDIILRGFYIGPFARTRASAWHPNADWIQDDLLDAEAAWRIIQSLPDAALDEVVAEKKVCVAQLSEGRTALQHVITEENEKVLDPLLNTLIYSESFFQALRDLLAGLVAYRRYQKTRDAGMAELTRQGLLAAQSHWNHHTQRHGSLPGAATAFRENHFWDLTQRILAEVTGEAR